MKPDEDFEDLEMNTYVGRSRTMSWLVLAIAVGGFAVLAYYAYYSASNGKKEEGSVLIEADNAPIKEAPADPEGEQFANKDKTIYDVIAPDGTKPVEKLMPEPERPIAAANTEDEDSIAAAQEPVVSAPVAVAPAPVAVAESKPEPVAPSAPVAEAAPAPVVPAPAKVVKLPEEKPADVKPVAVAPQATTTYVAEDPKTMAPITYATPQMVNERTVIGKPAETAAPAEEKTSDKPTKPEAKPVKTAAKPVEKPAATGGYKIQLGAYASEAEAQSAWKKISAAHAGVLSGAPTIVKAEVNGKTYYRLRAGSYASSADAKASCAKLGGQACMAVK